MFSFIMEKPTCDVCEKTFYSWGSVKHHKAAVHGSKRYQCPQCIKRFATICDRRKHIKRMHCLENEQKKLQDEIVRMNYTHVCDTCDKRFRKRSHLEHHIEGFHASTYLQCPLCIRRFPWKESLRNHLKITHTKSDLRYEKSCLNGMMQWKFMVDQCIPDDIMQTDDLRHIQLYMNYVKNKAAAYMDDNVDYT